MGLHTVIGFRDSFSGLPKLRGTILGVPVITQDNVKLGCMLVAVFCVKYHILFPNFLGWPYSEVCPSLTSQQVGPLEVDSEHMSCGLNLG